MRFAFPIRKPRQLPWEPCLPCPNRRTEPAATKAGHEFFVFGGYQDIDHVLSVVDVFDLDRGIWTGPIAMPPGAPQTHAGIACGGDRFIYLAGGQFGPQCRPAVADCFVLDARAKTWGRLPELPAPRYGPTVQFWNGRLHLLGGAMPDRWTSSCDHWSIAVSEGAAMENDWREEPPVPRGGPHRASAVIAGALYLFGGQDGDVMPTPNDPGGRCNWQTPLEAVFADSFRQEAGSDRWDRVAPMAVACSHAESVATIGHFAVLSGGNRGRNCLSDMVQVYDARGDRWIVAGRLPSLMKTSAVYHDGWLYVVAGQRSISRSDRRPGEVVDGVWRARFDPSAS